MTVKRASPAALILRILSDKIVHLTGVRSLLLGRLVLVVHEFILVVFVDVDSPESWGQGVFRHEEEQLQSIMRARECAIMDRSAAARMRVCLRFPQWQCREPKARTAVNGFICQQEGAAVTSPPARASPHIPAERTKIPTGAETELHTMVTLWHGVSVSCEATMEPADWPL